MKYINYYQSVSKTVCSALLSAGVLTASFSAQAAVENLQPSQSPLSLTKGVPPNVLITLDDSGSMAFNYAPDSINGSDDNAMQSNMYNSMYYNPDVTYVIPKKYSYNGTVVVGENKYTTSITSAKSDGFSSKSGSDISSKAYYYRYDPNLSCPVSPQRTRQEAPHCWAKFFSYYYYTSFDCPADKAVNKSGCYAKENVTADKQQNFANWYSFYRTRKLATQSAAILAFASMPDNVRLTWGALQKCHLGSNDAKTECNNEMARFAGQHRVNFFDWVEQLTVNGGTPLHAALHRAGEFLKTDTDDSVCRASYHVLMTDGMWNGRSSYHKNDADSTADAMPDGTAYTPRAPFSDGHTIAYTNDTSFSTNRTLADSAFYYWANDLKGVDNKVVPYMPIDTGNPAKDYWDPRNNPATWQHMVNFTVGLGLSNSLTNPDAPTWDSNNENPTYGDMDELFSVGASGKKWPSVRNDGSSNLSPDNVYDLWHAAINSRGEFFSADSPDSLVKAFEKILERISGRKTTASSPAINSGVGDDGRGYAFQASYEADKSWAGNLTAIKKEVDEFGKLIKSSAWPLGDASTQLATKAYTSRVIKMAGGPGLVDFKWSSLSKEQKGYLNRDPDVKNDEDTLGSSRVDFIRGDSSKEGSSFRKRVSVLGDIINSKPVTVRGARYLAGHANRIEGTSSKYEDFVSEQKGTTAKPRTPMVYVGANDGMLHGFNADTGEEIFAFVPTAVFPELNQLSAKGYGEAKHRFYVDGSPVVADVYLAGKGWRTVLVGTLGAGGKGMFALDVTDPTGPDGIQLLWEFNADKLMDVLDKDGKVKTKGADVKLGYTFSQPTIARLHNGKWAAVVGNGYAAAGSENGKASLLIIDMATGVLTKELVVQGVDKVPNGMSTPKLADINADGIADYAYAGDLQGNLWRFDLAPDNGDENNPFLREGAPRTSENFDRFQVSFGGNPLFVSKDTKGVRQPITAPPSIVRHPTGTGYIIVVGTGRYFVDSDKEGLSNASQTIYGIWDRTTKVARSATVPTIAARSNLLEQKMESATTAVDNGKKARVLSDKTVDWTKQNGWYFDLVLNKEMIVADMLQFGQTLYFQSLLPNANPCAAGVENWSYAINPATGGRTLHHAWTDYRNKGNPKTSITAVKMDGEGGLSIGQSPDKKFELCTGSECKEITPDRVSIGRQSWRMVPDA